jgi:hypothetical protein
MPAPNFHTRQLRADDAASVQSVYDSQPKLMLAPKRAGEPPYASTFTQLLASGCVAYGAFAADQLTAFVVVWPWPDLPVSSLVLFCSRPDGMVYNPSRTGLAQAMDACLHTLEAEQRFTLYFVRSSGGRWRHSVVRRRFGRFGQYDARPVEVLSAGQRSKFPGINARLLNGAAMRADCAIIVATAPTDQDF